MKERVLDTDTAAKESTNDQLIGLLLLRQSTLFGAAKDNPYRPIYQMARDSAIAILKQRLPRWIPVDEALPPVGQTVLVWRDELPPGTPPITAFWTGEKWCNDVMSHAFVVDRWQPLPPGPQESVHNGT